MASNRNDDMDRNRNTPQAGNRNPGVSGGTQGNTTQGRTTGSDPVNRDREMNRDTEVGQGGTGSGQSGRDSFGSDKSRGTGMTDTSKDKGRSDISE